MSPGQPRYRLLRLLGEGGFGTVHLAEDRQLGRPVALKRLRASSDPDLRSRFLREARATSGIRHPHVIEVYDFGLDPGGTPFLVYEYLEGSDLLHHARELGAPSPEQARTWAIQVAEALEAVHRAGLVHRDVKPENVLVRPDGSLVLADFGLARPEEGEKLTATGLLLGTPAFMAPEQFHGEAAGPGSDQFAWAASLVTLLVGESVYGSTDPGAILRRLGDPTPLTPPERLAADHPLLARVLGRALARVPEERFPSCSDFARACQDSPEARAPTSLDLSRSSGGGAATRVLVPGGGSLETSATVGLEARSPPGAPPSPRDLPLSGVPGAPRARGAPRSTPAPLVLALALVALALVASSWLPGSSPEGELSPVGSPLPGPTRQEEEDLRAEVLRSHAATQALFPPGFSSDNYRPETKQWLSEELQRGLTHPELAATWEAQVRSTLSWVVVAETRGDFLPSPEKGPPRQIGLFHREVDSLLDLLLAFQKVVESLEDPQEVFYRLHEAEDGTIPRGAVQAARDRVLQATRDAVQDQLAARDSPRIRSDLLLLQLASRSNAPGLPRIFRLVVADLPRDLDPGTAHEAFLNLVRELHYTDMSWPISCETRSLVHRELTRFLEEASPGATIATLSRLVSSVVLSRTRCQPEDYPGDQAVLLETLLPALERSLADPEALHRTREQPNDRSHFLLDGAAQTLEAQAEQDEWTRATATRLRELALRVTPYSAQAGKLESSTPRATPAKP